MLSYIIVRLLTRRREFIEGDELRHMASAKNFYKLWNRSFYDTHPPLYSWFISKLHQLGYYRAGVMVSLLCSIGLYIVAFKLFTHLGLDYSQRFLAMTALTFNYTLIYYSNKAFRYQLIALLGTCLIYFMLIKQYLLAGIAWGLLSLTCSFAGLRGIWIWMLTGANWLTCVIFFFAYGSWLTKKMKVYLNNRYYPSGIDGRVEPVHELTLRQLISPLYFPWTYSYYGSRELGFNFRDWAKKIGGVMGLYQTKHKVLNVLLYILTTIVVLFIIIGMVKSSWQLSIVTLILLYPSILKRFLPRNSIIAIPLLTYFMVKGIPFSVPITLTMWVNVLLMVGFLYFNRVWVFSIPKKKARLTSRILDNLPGDGVLSEGLIAYPIAYNSRKRVIVLSHSPDISEAIYQTDLAIDLYNISYIVFSEAYKSELHLGYPIIEFIKKNYKLLRAVVENRDKYYIYKVRS